MSKLRTLIVDDEPLARGRLRQMLQEESGIEIIGECEDGMEALEAIRKERPNLVFLDVQMPELDGFGLLSELGPERMPAIIFVTAHDQFALRAFEVHALDYLLKPFDAERLRTSLKRARSWLERRGDDDMGARLSAMLTDLRGVAGRPQDRLAVKSSGRVVLLKHEEIDWVEASDNYVNLHVGRESHLLRETMNSLEQRLPSDRFLRISRSTIVNLDRVRELQPLFHGEYSVILRDGTRLNLSRGYRDRLSLLLGKE